mmetsp:Transcript_17444/g.22714  ORF Transcript_17444/g.22714 Transcript_17444/m.22714 type:complete len:349 (+) Transcript_17444:145-1191(+)|eukprot:CAMPEP_0197294418 /NCGR_PEP_ID=MMETSP0890-20130614/32317_1 /TAXON_ID=44058 ORGANISM="Aureoumbra lagunensis, Strain CCMP1510" /NCGR_SAMPLE_ID=MMETSP0890 /ASSEMBLY_ACC=CAM_ASM_000533 /LENGTH=348 /DNA_ID=CAMNT_0042769817 /DNA_START=54 /DNA_END=1100 /DNA_ORIENTATION=+
MSKKKEEMCGGPISKRQKVVAASSVLDRVVKLNNGIEMPMVGIGTYKMKEGEVSTCVNAALAYGYRLIDTAYVYGGGKTESVIGKAIKKIDQQPFIITKHWRAFHGYEETKECLRTSLKRLDVDSVDLLLMHWPGPGYSAMGRSKARIEAEGIQCYFKKGHENIENLRLETWRAMEDELLAGRCKAIGVSNFSADHLTKLLAWPELRFKPALIQIELHPYLQQRDLINICKEHDIVIQAYASLGGQDSSAKDWTKLKQPALLEHPLITKLANKYSVDSAAILLAWALQHDIAIIPKSRSPSRIHANAQQLDSFQLSPDELSSIDDLNLDGMTGRLCWRRDELRNLDFD